MACFLLRHRTGNIFDSAYSFVGVVAIDAAIWCDCCKEVYFVLILSSGTYTAIATFFLPAATAAALVVDVAVAFAIVLDAAVVAVDIAGKALSAPCPSEQLENSILMPGRSAMLSTPEIIGKQLLLMINFLLLLMPMCL